MHLGRFGLNYGTNRENQQTFNMPISLRILDNFKVALTQAH